MAEHKKRRRNVVMTVVSAAIFALAVAAAVYIMVNHLGLQDSLDFGAGAYYYADMPGFEKFVDAEHYKSPVPLWVLIALFLAWGALMYRLWSWLEKKSRPDEEAPVSGQA